jgi:anti-anti-sigma factor
VNRQTEEESMATPFAVRTHDDGGGIARLTVSGELDHDTSAALLDSVRSATEQGGVTEVVVDLRQVTVLAAAGVRALVEGRETASRAGCRCRIVNAHGIALQVLTVSGLLDVLAVTPLVRITGPRASA